MSEALAALFTAPQISTDEHGRHLDESGREYVADLVEGETRFRPAAVGPDHPTEGVRVL